MKCVARVPLNPTAKCTHGKHLFENCKRETMLVLVRQWRIQHFPDYLAWSLLETTWKWRISRGGSRIPCRRGRRPSREVANIQFCQNVQKTAWNWEIFEPCGGGGARGSPLDPPLTLDLEGTCSSCPFPLDQSMVPILICGSMNHVGPYILIVVCQGGITLPPLVLHIQYWWI